MAPLKDVRPESIEQALEHLASGVALGGGTTLAPRRNSLETVVDLQGLGLSDLEVAGGKVVAGAGCSLQQIVEAKGTMVEALVEACRREAPWNLPNMATLARRGQRRLPFAGRLRSSPPPGGGRQGPERSEGQGPEGEGLMRLRLTL